MPLPYGLHTILRESNTDTAGLDKENRDIILVKNHYSMNNHKLCVLVLMVLIPASLKLFCQDFKVIIPDPDIIGVTTVNIADLNNDQLPDIAAFEGGKHARGRQLFAWYEAPD